MRGIHLILLICIFCYIQKSFGYFSKTYDFGEVNYVYSSSILAENDSTAICYTTSENNKVYSINLSRINLKNGNILLTKKYSFFPNTIRGYYFLSLIKSQYFEGYYAAFNIADSLFKNTQTIVFKLNLQLDTLLTFRTNTYKVVYGNSIVEGTDSCIYFAGSNAFFNHDDSTQTCLFKFDPSGNLLFQKFYNLALSKDGAGNLVLDKNSNIYLGGGLVVYSTILKDRIGQPYILKLNKNGDIIKYINYGSPDKDECGWNLRIHNDTLYAGGCKGRRFIAKLDTNLLEIDRYYIPYIIDSPSKFDMRYQINHSGYIILAASADGPTIKFPNGKYGQISLGGYVGKMNRYNGNILWERVYNCLKDTVGLNYISGLVFTPSNDILLIGSGLVDSIPKNYKNYDWILYLDSNGCISPTECGEWSRKDTFSSVIENKMPYAEIYFYPNPVKDILHLKLPSSVNNKSIILIDALGRIFYQENTFNTDIEIDMSAWPPGIYVLQIHTTTGKESVKIMKE